MAAAAGTQVNIKWGKENYTVDVEPGTSVEIFKTQVWTLTMVPTDKQKYAGIPGGLKDDDDLMTKLGKIKAGAKIMLIGTAEEKQLSTPAEKTVFEEDLTEEERRKLLKEKKIEVLPPGMKNLGNTCYMNSTLQCLFRCKELKDAIMNYNVPGDTAQRDIDSTMTVQCKGVINQLAQPTDAIVPMSFVGALRQRFPRFAEMKNGGFMQQDAEECLRGVLEVLRNTLVAEGGNHVDNIFGFDMKSTLKCLECDEEAPTTSNERQLVLICHLGTQTEQVSHIHQGVQVSMKEHIEKNSPALARNAQYEKTASMASLPTFLLVQFARFGYKGANDWAGTSASKVKLTKRLAFSWNFDAFDFAGDELKKQLSEGRMEKKRQDDEEIERERKRRLEGAAGKTAEKAAEEAKAAEDVEMLDTSDCDELDTGYYELVGVVSHKGRTADGGHYVGWARHAKADGKELKDDKWILFDDEDVSWWNWKDMVGLSCDLQGGKADTQIAYINIYRKVTVLRKRGGPGHVLGTAEGAAPAAAAAAPKPEA